MRSVRTNQPKGNQSPKNHARLGFTLVEMIVTIGILAVITAGIATIFNSIGDTVSKGRKLSELNQFAARIERIMREDFESMTRDGFLVIVNKNASNGQGLDQDGIQSWDTQLFRGEETNIDRDLYPGFSNGKGRIRRSDEIMFFARGEFETSRRAISPGMIARSSEAAIYYGHGQKRRPDLLGIDARNNYFFNPAPWDNNFDSVLDTRLGVSTPGFVNPNEFARDWSLLRQVTLLVNPQGTGQTVPRELFGLFRNNAFDRPYLEDSPRQIALQPAGRSIFTSLNGTDRTKNHRWIYDLATSGSLSMIVPPHFRTSGLVDIVTEDLGTIRGMVQALSFSASPEMYFNYNPALPNPILTNRDDFENLYWGNLATPPNPNDAMTIDFGRANPTTGAWSVVTPAQQDRIRRTRKWMIDALPSRWDLSGVNPFFVSGVRYEDIPTRMLFSQDYFTNNFASNPQLAQAYVEANQEMLGSSVFVPRCTEFVVEWSYGFVNNAIVNPLDPNFKQLMWYGLDRFVDSNNDGLIRSDGSDRLAASGYFTRSAAQAGMDVTDIASPRRRSLGVSPLLVVDGPGGGGTSPADVEIATFGFSTMASNAGAVWKWPRYIRITMSLGDPSDREIEETYQVIFELPELE